MNLGCLFLFSDFTYGRQRTPGSLSILAGNYRDFDTDWFYDIGAKVTMAMISNSIAPHMKIIAEPFVQRLALRWFLDRCFKKHLRKKANMEGEQTQKDGEKEDDVQKEGGEDPPEAGDEAIEADQE